MKIEPVYHCPFCKTPHSTEEQALACFNSTPKPQFKPGDIVILRLGYAWYDGLEHWVVDQEGGEWRNGELYRFYGVVTSVDLDDRRYGRQQHRWLYSVDTLAVGQVWGWTSLEDHHKLKLAENVPDQVREEAKALVGRRFDRLL